jgi:hypothetical protein
MHARDKKLNEMNRLGDMAHFPAIVNAGATANILMTITLTWLLQSRYPQTFAPVVWSAIVLCLNLLPVVLLRLAAKPGSPCPTLAEMDFVKDQHRFSDWVYLAASANMAFWILLAWSIFSITNTPSVLAVLLGGAFLVTFSPVLLRGKRP